MNSSDKTELSTLKKGLVSRDVLDSFEKDSLVDLLPGVESKSVGTKFHEIIPRRINFHEEEDVNPKSDDVGSVSSEEYIGQSFTCASAADHSTLCRDHLGKMLFMLLLMFSVTEYFLKVVKITMKILVMKVVLRRTQQREVGFIKKKMEIKINVRLHLMLYLYLTLRSSRSVLINLVTPFISAGSLN